MDKLLEKFIKEWRLKNNTKDAIYSSYHYDAMIEFAKHYHTQQLTLTDVSQQRELLKAYSDWHKKYRDSSYFDPYNVDNYLNSL
jgi:hypothetical protein